MNNNEKNDSLPSGDGENGSKLQTAIPPAFEPTYSAAVEAAVRSIMAKQSTPSAQSACCASATSYIHVYQHAAQCQGREHARSDEGIACASQPATEQPVTTESKGVEIEFPTFASLFSSAKSLFKHMRSSTVPVPGSSESTKQNPEEKKPSTNTNEEDDEQTDGDTTSSTATNTDRVDSTDSHLHDPEWDEMFPPPPPQRKVWYGLDGMAAMLFGVAAPLLISLMTIASCPKRITLVLLNHPVETIIELALLLIIPLMNYKVWSSICKNDVRFSLRRGIALGAGIASALVIAGLSFAAIPAGYNEMAAQVGTDFSVGFFVMGLLALGAAITGLSLMNRARLRREFSSTRARVVAYTLVGLAGGLVVFAACEARSWYVRIAERMAMSAKQTDRENGLAILRSMDTERELRMDCSDARAAGIAGLFIPVKRAELQELYFNVTGKPFQDENSKDFSSMPDWYLKRHVVGTPVKGLFLARSAFNGKIHPTSLTSTVNWTLVFRNDTEVSQEARAEIVLPPGATITGMTSWKQGDPAQAEFYAAAKEDNADWINVGHSTPAIVKDLGRGRHLFHCYPVLADEELKINIQAVVPLQLESLTRTTLTFPRFVATNFSLEGENTLTLESADGLHSRASNLKSTRNSNTGEHVLSGVLERSQIEHTALVITADRQPTMKAVAASDWVTATIADEEKKAIEEQKRVEAEQKRAQEKANAPEEPKFVVTIDGSKGIEGLKGLLEKKSAAKVPEKKDEELKPKWVVRTIEETVIEAPKQLMIVLDGSAEMAQYRDRIKKALQTVPASMKVFLSVASSEEKAFSQPTKLQEALAGFEKIKFVGGQDNLKSVVMSAEAASKTNGGAVLWIHGPQPTLSKDIYILSPFGSRPSFFELSLDDGVTDTVEYFKNHGEIGPFKPIERTANIGEDLADFFDKWMAGKKTYQLNWALLDEQPTKADILDDRAEQELLAVHGLHLVYEEVKAKELSKATRYAVDYRLVTPVSCASIISDAPQTTVDNFSTEENNQTAPEPAPTEAAAPTIQGATNGTIGPQGVNTAGTVRVNNLANLEALLNMICNLVQVGGLLIGLGIGLHAFLVRKTITSFFGVKTRLTPGARLALGLVILASSSMLPGLVNWFIASARDANLFS